MLQNPDSQFQIPTDNRNSDSVVPVYDSVLERVYDVYRSQSQNVSEASINSKTWIEKVSPAIKRLNVIGDGIGQARSDRLKLLTQSSRRIFVKDIAELFFNRALPDRSYELLAKNELVENESKIGASVFGLSTTDKQRTEFFYDGRDENGIDSWFFHQEKTDDVSGDLSSITHHFEVLPTGVLLVGRRYLQAEEFDNFTLATEMYNERVMGQIYSKNEFANSSNQSNKGLGQVVKKVIRLFGDNDNRGNGRLAA
jgi:hypothetical protein